MVPVGLDFFWSSTTTLYHHFIRNMSPEPNYGPGSGFGALPPAAVAGLLTVASTT